MQKNKRVLHQQDDEDKYQCPDISTMRNKSVSNTINDNSRSLKLQNTITAYSLGMDTKGNHYGWMLLSTREQAAGIPIAIPYKIRSRSANKDKIVTESTKLIPSLIQQVIDVYEKCGNIQRSECSHS